MDEPSEADDLIARQVVDSAFAVHSSLGPGLLESVYGQCLAYELQTRNLRATRQIQLPIHYGDTIIDGGLRFDMMVNESVIVEIKAVEAILPLHKAQLLTYLKLARRRLGLLINFNVPLIKDGIRRVLG